MHLLYACHKSAYNHIYIEAEARSQFVCLMHASLPAHIYMHHVYININKMA